MTTTVLLPGRDRHLMSDTSEKISKGSYISLSIAAGACALAGGAGSLIASLTMGHQFDLRLQALESEVRTLGEKVDSSATDKWRGRDMRMWTRTLEELNPELRVPDIGDD